MSSVQIWRVFFQVDLSLDQDLLRFSYNQMLIVNFFITVHVIWAMGLAESPTDIFETTQLSVTLNTTTSSEAAYDADGAMKYIVATLSVYALLGIMSLMIVRIIRRAKQKWV